MEYKLAVKPKANGASSIAVAVSDIRAAFSNVREPGGKNGRRYELTAMLSLAVVAILSNHLSVTAIAEWGHAILQN